MSCRFRHLVFGENPNTMARLAEQQQQLLELPTTRRNNNNHNNHNNHKIKKKKKPWMPSTDHRMLSYDPQTQVEKIECDEIGTEFKTFDEPSFIAIQVDGHLDKNDYADLGHVLKDTFRTTTAVLCDPSQRVIHSIDSSLIQSFERIPASDNDHQDWTLYEVTVGYYGPPDPTTALVQNDDLTETFTRNQETECPLSGILDDDQVDCPFKGCYCPTALLDEPVQKGVTEEQLRMGLDGAVQHCQEKGSDGSGEEMSSGSGKSKKGKSGSSGGSDCLSDVHEVTAVRELREIDCGTFDVVDTFNFVSAIGDDPCLLRKKKTDEWFALFVESYNQEQFELCESRFTRLENTFYNFDFKKCGEGDRTRRLHDVDMDPGDRRRHRRLFGSEFPWGGNFSSKDDTGSEDDDDGDQGRRDLVERYIQSPASNQTLPHGMVHHRRASGMSDFSDTKKDDSRCFCPASATPGDGVVLDELNSLLDDALRQTTEQAFGTDNAFGVLRSLNGTVGCTGKRKEVDFQAIVVFNEDTCNLSDDDLAVIAKDGVVGYNLFVAENCPVNFPRLESCVFSRFEPCGIPDGDGDCCRLRHGRRRELEFEFEGEEGEFDALLIQCTGVSSINTSRCRVLSRRDRPARRE